MSATHISLSSGEDELQIPLKYKHCGIVKGSFSMCNVRTSGRHQQIKTQSADLRFWITPCLA